MEREITFLNGMGDVTITWNEQEDNRIKDLIQEKINQGYTFFIVEKRNILPDKKRKISSAKELGNKQKVVLDDNVLEDLFSNNKIQVYSDQETTEIEAKGKLVDARQWFKRKETEQNQEKLVGVRRAVGG